MTLHHQLTHLNPMTSMSNTKCLFLCPAYKPSNQEQVLLFKNNCERLAEQFAMSYEFLTESLQQPGIGDWQRYLSKDFHDQILQYRYLWPIRGGYGCINWADDLLNSRRQQVPHLIGYSDVSIWHNIWHIKNWGESTYAFMPGTLWGDTAEASLERCLAGTAWEISIEHVPDVRVLREGAASGRSFVSCLRVLSNCTGTALQPNLEGHILALEDIDERPYSIDRDMQQLYRAGVLEGIRGLVIGTMPSESPVGYAGPSIADLFRHWGERLQIPVIHALPFGHVSDPISLPIGRQSYLTASASTWSWSFSQRDLS